MWLRRRLAHTTRPGPGQESQDPFTARAFEELLRPPPSVAKDIVGFAATLAIIGAVLLWVTNSLGSACRAQLRPRIAPGACSGMPAIASHAAPIVAWSAAACAALAAVAFVWYMFWGYKARQRTGGKS
jgi:hypothetical protein